MGKKKADGALLAVSRHRKMDSIDRACIQIGVISGCQSVKIRIFDAETTKRTKERPESHYPHITTTERKMGVHRRSHVFAAAGRCSMGIRGGGSTYHSTSCPDVQ